MKQEHDYNTEIPELLLQQNENTPSEERVELPAAEEPKQLDASITENVDTSQRETLHEEQVTPVKKNTLTSSGDNQKPSTSKFDLIPSPFKRALMWPEPQEMAKSKRRREKLPAVATSPQMLEYYRKKEKQKMDTQKLKDDRKKQGNKEKNLEEKRMQQKKKKQKIEEESSDSNSELEISLQESDISNSDERSDEEEYVTKVNS
uniref:Uncharacterized protein DDB_G0286299-like n=1 Tax=Diabrotica virgifera virgifera TaxID=50390 RepID=A0A6P7GFR3_DIAVI